MNKRNRKGPRRDDGIKKKRKAGFTRLAAASPSRHALFLHLSRVLTAHELDEGLAKLYLERTRQVAGTQVDDLLDRFKSLLSAGRDPIRAVREDIMPDQVLGPVAQTILLLWYIGGIQAPGGGDWQMQSADQYYRALVWETIGAHPPTLSNGYFGHWKYPPEM